MGADVYLQMKLTIYILTLVVAVLLCSCREATLIERVSQFDKDADGAIPQGASFISWEWQSWEASGPSHQVTIWADGRVEHRCRAYFHALALPGWQQEENSFIRKGDLPTDEARQLFAEAFRLGIHKLKAVKADYADGSGVVVTVAIGEESRSVTVAEMVDPRNKNMIRFHALSQLFRPHLDVGYTYAQ